MSSSVMEGGREASGGGGNAKRGFNGVSGEASTKDFAPHSQRQGKVLSHLRIQHETSVIGVEEWNFRFPSDRRREKKKKQAFSLTSRGNR